MYTIRWDYRVRTISEISNLHRPAAGNRHRNLAGDIHPHRNHLRSRFLKVKMSETFLLGKYKQDYIPALKPPASYKIEIG